MESSDPSQEGKIVTTIRGYARLCKDAGTRTKMCSDEKFAGYAASLVASNHQQIVIHTVKVLLLLTQKREDAALLVRFTHLIEAIRTAADNENLSPSVLQNLVLLSSRLTSASENRSSPAVARRRSEAVAPQRRFVSRTSIQFTFCVKDLEENDELRRAIEEAIIAVKGVISVCFANETIVLRVTAALNAQKVANVLFKAGALVVKRVVRGENGRNEMWEMNMDEDVQAAPPLPDYIEDLEPANPNSCVVVGDRNTSSGGWINSISSFNPFSRFW